MKKSESFMKDALADVFDFLAFKVRHGVMTEDDVRAVMSVINSECGVKATIKDLSAFYRKPESQVRATIARKMFAKPKRVVLYPFCEFRKIVPEGWNRCCGQGADSKQEN